METIDHINTEHAAMEEAKEKLSVDDIKAESTRLSHQELVRLTKTTITDIIESDPLLTGLPLDVTTDELKSQIAVVQGQAITVFLNRGELPKLAVVVILTYINFILVVKSFNNLNDFLLTFY